ncbi:hypothetical protein [Sutcliffiella horikoshii]|uniref:hypothetical protein n=1 Tax=Sutcliffiella horikoshii TaxID=79883 RepID=UPI001CBE48B1|nr:hypothetical protein [Sutcliffiella horikoshii]UAL46001.1 hypothetical protein K7887_13765 [Sutcliffiella horikoshii]
MFEKEEKVLIVDMKTSVTRKKEERSPHRRYEDLSDKEKEGERVLIAVMKTSVTRKKEERGPHH